MSWGAGFGILAGILLVPRLTAFALNALNRRFARSAEKTA